MTHRSLPLNVLLAVFASAACPPVVTSTSQVFVVTTAANNEFKDATGGNAEDECLRIATGQDGFVRGEQPLFIRHHLGADLQAARQGLTAELTLETVCERRTLDAVPYGEDGRLIKPLLAPRAAECGLLVTLRVADGETICSVPADSEACAALAPACVTEGDSSGGSSSGGSGETVAEATTGG